MAAQIKRHSVEQHFLFAVTLGTMLMMGIALDPGLNQWVRDAPTVTPLIAYEEPTLQLSPSPSVDALPIIAGLIIILLAALAKQDILTLKSIGIMVRAMFKAVSRTLRQVSRRLFRFMLRLPRMVQPPVVDVHAATKKAKKSHVALRRAVASEMNKTHRLFTKQHEEQDTRHFIGLLMILFVLGMALFASLPVFNPTVFQSHPIEPKIQIIYPIDSGHIALSPSLPFGNWGILLGLAIVAGAIFFKSRRNGGRGK